MGAVTGTSEYEVVIEPKRGLLRLELKELWEYRDLLVLLLRRDLLARYQQTLLGPLWHVLQPVLTMAVFVIIFTRIAGISTGGVPAPLFYLSGLLAWNYFAQNITTASGTFLNNQGLFSKVWFPRLVVPLSAIASNFISFGLQLIPFIGFALYYALSHGIMVFTWRLALLPFAAIHVAAVSLGVGLWMAAFTARYRDLLHLNQFLVQLWMFATPVIYPLSKIPPRLSWIAWMNPVAAPVEEFRWCLLGSGTLDPALIGVSLLITAVLVFTGLVVFQNASRSAVDIV